MRPVSQAVVEWESGNSTDYRIEGSVNGTDWTPLARVQNTGTADHRRDTADFPTATLKLAAPIRLGTVPAKGVTITKRAQAKLTMHGVPRTISFPVHARRSGALIEISASIPITFADWNIANPSGGPATTADNGIIEVLINLTRL